MPIWFARVEPDTNVHVPPEYFHRSFRNPKVPAPSLPYPPNSQKFPAASVHVRALTRAPGYGLAVGGEIPFWSRFAVAGPLCQLHVPVLFVYVLVLLPPNALALNFQRSLR